MLHIIITAYGEPKATEKAVRCILDQDLPVNTKIIVCDPFPDVKTYIEKKFGNKIEFFVDPDEGKSTALNIIFNNIWSENIDDIIMMTDGDVFLEKNSVREIISKFKDKKVGVVCGHPVPLNDKNTKYGFWAHFQFHCMNLIRKTFAVKDKFFETSGYLWAIRNGVIKSFPIDSSEDSIVPYLFYDKGYYVDYSENAKVLVLNPQNWNDWINQRKRNIKGHSTIEKNKPKNSPKRIKTFLNEVKKGVLMSLSYPKSIKEWIWMLQFYFARTYGWFIAYYEMKFKKKKYKDGWRETEMASTRPLD
ncbi:MAG TPA: glycosyltransferase family 2 protein [Candidatus Nanoarchaeia archaeon]|nr:glycosyltransferase family 2 protein [Candidatus Nanoarchaeia archaeon]